MRHLLLSLLCCGLFLPALSAQTQLTREYALILQDPPVARGIGSRYELHTARAVAQAARIEQAQQGLRRALAGRNVRVLASVKTLLNAVFVVASPDQVPALRALPGVVRVAPLRKMKLHLNAALPLVRAPQAWAALSSTGLTNPGAGVKVAIVDTGIDQNHPAFQDSSLQPPAGYPLCAGDAVAKTGDCAYTNSKVIVARSYVWLSAQGSPQTSSPDDLSPRDRVGHGTATAMIAAGGEHQAPLAKISGVAPKAFLGNYKVFGSPGVNDGASSSAVIKALDDAFNDGMDIASVSLGFPAWFGPNDKGADCGNPNFPDAPCEVEAQTVEAAVANGMVVVVSAGNDGDYGLYAPTLSTIHTPGISPSAITVGASRNGHEFFESVSAAGVGAPDNVRNLAASFGDGPMPSQPLTAPLGDVNGLGCTAIAPATLSGAIALIQRGNCYFSDKAANAQAAGAVGVVFYCDDTQYCADGGETPFSPGGLAASTIPAVLVGRTSGRSLKAYAASSSNAQVTLDPAIREFADPDVDTLAPFSSRGPSIAPETALKPEVVAPGTNIYTAAQRYDTNGVMYSPDGYTAQNGTSFSAPMVAGVAALVKQKNRNFTPGQIKSAIVNTATTDVTDGSAPAAVTAVGAGKLNAEGAVKSNVTAEPATLSFGVLTQLMVAPGSSAGTRSLKVTNNSNRGVTLAVVQGDPDALLHLHLSSNSVAPGQSTIQVSLEGNVPLPGSYAGAVTITGGAVDLRVPYHYLVGDNTPDNIVSATSKSFDGTVNEIWYRALRVIDRYGAAVVDTPVQWSASGGATIDPDPTYPTDSKTYAYGFAGAYIVLGPTADTHQTITATIGSGTSAMQFPFDAFPRAKPAVGTDTNGQLGVVNGASFVSLNGGSPALAPGSYISLFGSKLSDAEASFDWYLPQDYIYLPLSLAGVTVSFDAGAISVPGHLSYVNPGQVNVQIPWELQGQSSADIKVRVGGSTSDVYSIRLADSAPGIFEFDPYQTGQSWAAAQHPTQPVYTAVGPSNPAEKGEVIVVWVNGLGPVDNQPASGELSPASPLAKAKVMPAITIGGKNVNDVEFAGLAPGFIGLHQINLRIPDDAPSGPQDMVVTVNGNSSKAARISIK